MGGPNITPQHHCALHGREWTTDRILSPQGSRAQVRILRNGFEHFEVVECLRWDTWGHRADSYSRTLLGMHRFAHTVLTLSASSATRMIASALRCVCESFDSCLC